MTKKREEILNSVRERSGKKGGSRIKNRTYKVLDGNEHAKLSPQAVRCLEIIYEQDKEELSEQEMFDLFQDCEMKTKQEPWKIFQYYRKSLKDQGFIEVVDNKSTVVS